MPRGTRLLLVVLSVPALALVGCRADAEDCQALAEHIVELAQAEGKGGGATSLALERDCAAQRPTRALVECMMAAETLAELDGC
ncbi:hypothetical protein ENSA5_00590 [Enhygromyxa salina]|uniref:Cysteine rich repeat protein n=1 Tax=Enhygromyxa salina TaxID=215803 RepID=A0A2S9YKW6_9BACT|nr:hypothetical protein [Enhygromyxa salina]PRQ05739.1 hypothetical protein ENSA5_00590 [Enhygromyxa salina]